MSIAEAYPRTAAQTDAKNYHGPLQMYLDAGFTPYWEIDGFVAVRRKL